MNEQKYKELVAWLAGALVDEGLHRTVERAKKLYPDVIDWDEVLES